VKRFRLECLWAGARLRVNDELHLTGPFHTSFDILPACCCAQLSCAFQRDRKGRTE
jgi:hypothetical protein